MNFTSDYDEVVERSIQRQLGVAIEIILKHMENPPTGIVLSGGFGRGEGTVVKTKKGVSPVNDYDFLVVTKETDVDLQGIGTAIARELKMNLVDVGGMGLAMLGHLRPTQWAYDLKYGSRVIFGDPSLLDLIPKFTANQIPIWDAIKLLCNRMIGAIGAGLLRPAVFLTSPKRAQWLVVQIDHMLISCGDSFLISSKLYHHSYRERFETLKSLRETWFSNEDLRIILEAYRRKLSTWDSYVRCTPEDFEEKLMQISPIVETAYLQSMRKYLGRQVSSLDEAIRGYYSAHRLSVGQRMRRLISRIIGIHQEDGFYNARAAPIDVCYTLIPPCFYAGPWQPDDRQREAMATLLKRFIPSRSNEATPDYHLRVSRDIYALWERHCH